MKEQGLFHSTAAPEPEYSDTLSLDLATVEPSLAGPRRPQDRVPLRDVARSFHLVLPALMKPSSPIAPPQNMGRWEGEGGGGGVATSVVIAAITSCTNTSNPSVMIAAGLVAKKAVEKGLRSQPWVKTSLAPGSKVRSEE